MNHGLTVLERIIPEYQVLGPISFAWAQGSVVSGYATEGDYDVILAWSLADLPREERRSVVARLDERNPDHPFVVDDRDINIDRFVIEGREFNIGHATTAGFRKSHIDPVLAGVAFREEDILQPVVTVSGFYYGNILLDRNGEGASLKDVLRHFPDPLRKDALRLLRLCRSDLPVLRGLGERGDWIPYFRDLSRIVRTILFALFAAHDVYYPGDKWVLKALERFAIGADAAGAWEQIWKRGVSLRDQIAAVDALGKITETRLSPMIES